MAHASAEVGLIGPNAIIQVAKALREIMGEETTRLIFARAHLERHLAHLPTSMVPEDDVGALQTALFEGLDENEARKVAFDAGLKTGDYLLANRIPKLAQAVLKRLPAAFASNILLSTIQKHSWTFSGTGEFSVANGRPVRVSIKGCPLCRGRQSAHPQCDFYTGTFQRLFEVLVSRNTVVREIQCEAVGDPACVFEISWAKSRWAKSRRAAGSRIHTGKEEA